MLSHLMGCSVRVSLLAASLGSLLAIAGLSLLVDLHSMPLLVASAGASAFLLYGSPCSPYAQPRNCIFGHMISAIVGVGICQIVGNSSLACALGVSLAILAMMLTKTDHPPGAATALHAVITGQGFGFVLNPVLPKSILMVVVALWVHGNIPGQPVYPWNNYD